MAIQVVDPRNNLLSQLTQVGQQFLAGRQEERASAQKFAQQKELAGLLNTAAAKRAKVANDQDKAMFLLKNAHELNLSDKEMEQLKGKIYGDMQIAGIHEKGATDRTQLQTAANLGIAESGNTSAENIQAGVNQKNIATTGMSEAGANTRTATQAASDLALLTQGGTNDLNLQGLRGTQANDLQALLGSQVLEQIGAQGESDLALQTVGGNQDIIRQGLINSGNLAVQQTAGNQDIIRQGLVNSGNLALQTAGGNQALASQGLRQGHEQTIQTTAGNQALVSQGLQHGHERALQATGGEQALTSQALAQQGQESMLKLEQKGQSRLMRQQAGAAIRLARVHGGVEKMLLKAQDKFNIQAREDVFKYQKQLLEMNQNASSESERRQIQGQLDALDKQFAGQGFLQQQVFDNQQAPVDPLLNTLKNFEKVGAALNFGKTDSETITPELRGLASDFDPSGIFSGTFGAGNTLEAITSDRNSAEGLANRISDIDNLPATRNLTDAVTGSDDKTRLKELLQKRVDEIRRGEEDNMSTRLALINFTRSLQN